MNDRQWTKEEKRLITIGQMTGLQRADLEDQGDRWGVGVIEMALSVAMHRLGLTELEFALEEWIDSIDDDAAGFIKQQVDVDRFRVEAVTKSDIDRRREAQIAAMFGSGAEGGAEA